MQKECYVVYKSVQKFAFYLTGTGCTLYCNHKLLTPFFSAECLVMFSIEGIGATAVQHEI